MPHQGFEEPLQGQLQVVRLPLGLSVNPRKLLAFKSSTIVATSNFSYRSPRQSACCSTEGNDKARNLFAEVPQRTGFQRRDGQFLCAQKFSCLGECEGLPQNTSDVSVVLESEQRPTCQKAFCLVDLRPMGFIKLTVGRRVEHREARTVKPTTRYQGPEVTQKSLTAPDFGPTSGLTGRLRTPEM